MDCLGCLKGSDGLEIVLAAGEEAFVNEMLKRVWLGAAGGMLAGTLVGLCEAMVILTSSGTGEYQALVYASVLYAGIGLGMGIGVGVGVAVLGKLMKKLSDPVGWALGFVGVFVPLGLVITKYVVNKVVYAEAGIPGPVMLGILGGFAAFAVLVLWLGGILLSRTPLRALLKPKGHFAAYGGLVALSAIYSFAPGGEDPAGTMVPQKAAQDAPGGAPDVVLVVVDTMRADYLGPYGDTHGLSPNIDKLAEESVVFEQYVTQASWTRASFASLYTSAAPSSHKSKLKAQPLLDENETLAEVMSAAGYATGGMPNNINVTRSFNFQQGFDWFEYQAPSYIAGATESSAQLSMYNVLRKLRDKLTSGKYTVTDYYQPAEVSLKRAREFVKKNKDADNRWFLIIHLMEPHDPYFAHPYDGSAVGRAWRPNPDPSEADALKALYRGEVKHMDTQLGEFMDWMKAEGVWDDTLFVVTADHGEEFQEHGGWWHGITLYDEQIHVPLIVKTPGDNHKGWRVPWQVREIDVAPTIASFAKVENLPATWQGSDIFDADASAMMEKLHAPPAPKPEPVVGEDGELIEVPVEEPVISVETLERVAIAEQDFEGNQIDAIRKGGCKYIRVNEGNPRGLPVLAAFDVSTDITEQKNLVEAGGGPCDLVDLEANLMSEILDAKKASPIEGDNEVSEDEISCDDCQRLLMLGYMSDCSASCGG